jgi:hypothetical protein
LAVNSKIPAGDDKKNKKTPPVKERTDFPAKKKNCPDIYRQSQNIQALT